MSIRGAVVVALGLAALCTVGCKGITTPSDNQNETFSGTLQPQSEGKGHAFSVGKTGEFTAKLTAWGPNSNILAGMAWVVDDGSGSCTGGILQRNFFVPLNSQALGGQIVSGKYCIVVFDPGTLTAAQTYTITVSHP